MVKIEIAGGLDEFHPLASPHFLKDDTSVCPNWKVHASPNNHVFCVKQSIASFPLFSHRQSGRDLNAKVMPSELSLILS